MPQKVIILYVLLLFAGYAATAGQKIVPGQWQRDWLLAGPFQLQPPAPDDPELKHLVGFETDFLQNSGGERNPIVVENADFEYQNQTFSWRAFLAQDSIVDLDAAVSKKPFVAAYAFRQVDVPRDQICLLSLGSNDGARVWLNGAQVWDRPLPGGIVVDDALIPVFLHKGNNTLLIKVEERGNVWGFCARFLPLERKKKQALFFRIAVYKDGSAALRFLFHEELIASLFEKASIEIIARDKPDQILWSGDWSMTEKMALPIDSALADDYLLRVRAKLADGRDWSQDIPFTAGVRHEYVLFENGRTKYEIVVSGSASASAHWAAEELQHWLQETSGAFFPIVQNPTPGKSGIFVGAERSLNGDEEDAGQIVADDDESFRYENSGGDIFIPADSAASCMAL